MSPSQRVAFLALFSLLLFGFEVETAFVDLLRSRNSLVVRKAEQLAQNLGAVGWNLTASHVAQLDAASHREPTYLYWHQAGFERNPFPMNIG
jgi:hypothetical protein